MGGDKCRRQEKLVPIVRKNTKKEKMYMSEIRTLGEHLLKVKGVKFYWKNYAKLSIDEGLYNELKA